MSRRARRIVVSKAIGMVGWTPKIRGCGARSAAIVGMAMVQVGKMRVAVHEPAHGGADACAARLGRLLGPVAMPMVLIVQMRVLMLDRLVRMLVLVPLGQVEPDAREPSEPPAASSCAASAARRSMGTASSAPTKGAVAKVGAGARGPEMPQRQDEQDQAHAVAEKADQHAAEKRAGRGE